jgi:hypothetical protein
MPAEQPGRPKADGRPPRLHPRSGAAAARGDAAPAQSRGEGVWARLASSGAQQPSGGDGIGRAQESGAQQVGNGLELGAGPGAAQPWERPSYMDLESEAGGARQRGELVPPRPSVHLRCAPHLGSLDAVWGAASVAAGIQSHATRGAAGTRLAKTQGPVVWRAPIALFNVVQKQHALVGCRRAEA